MLMEITKLTWKNIKAYFLFVMYVQSSLLPKRVEGSTFILSILHTKVALLFIKSYKKWAQQYIVKCQESAVSRESTLPAVSLDSLARHNIV